MIVVTPYLVRPVDDSEIALPTDGYRAPTRRAAAVLDRPEQPPACPARAAGSPAAAGARRRSRRCRRAPAAAAPRPGFKLLMPPRAQEGRMMMQHVTSPLLRRAAALAGLRCTAAADRADQRGVESRQPAGRRAHQLRARPRRRRTARLPRSERRASTAGSARSASATATASTSTAAGYDAGAATTSPRVAGRLRPAARRRRAGHRGRVAAGHGPRGRQPHSRQRSRLPELAATVGSPTSTTPRCRTIGCAINGNLAAMVADPERPGARPRRQRRRRCD